MSTRTFIKTVGMRLGALLLYLGGAAVGVLLEFSATWVRPSRIRNTVSLATATMGSQPITRSAAAIATRVVRMSLC